MRRESNDKSRSSVKQLKRLKDEDLVTKALETANPIYLEELYDRYADKVYGKCIQMAKDEDLAKDLCQDILIKAFSKLETFNKKSKFGTWLFQVTYSYCIDHFRKTQRYVHKPYEEEMVDSALTDNQDDVLDQQEVELKLTLVKRILNDIRIEEKVLILQKYQDQLSIAELAELYETTESAIKMKLKRSRDKIRRLYEEYNKEDPHSRLAQRKLKDTKTPNNRRGNKSSSSEFIVTLKISLFALIYHVFPNYKIS